MGSACRGLSRDRDNCAAPDTIGGALDERRSANTSDLSLPRDHLAGMPLADSVTPSKAAAAVAALLAIVVFAPLVVVSGAGSALGNFYAAGPFGLTAVGLLAVVGTVVFLSVDRSHTDTVTLSGVGLVVAVGTVLVAAVWLLSLSPSTLYGFPPAYDWLEQYRWAPLAGSLVFLAAGGLQARDVL